MLVRTQLYRRDVLETLKDGQQAAAAAAAAVRGSVSSKAVRPVFSP